MSASVVVAAEQLRRQVPGGVGRYASCLLGGLAPRGGEPPSVSVFASRHRGGRDPLDRFGFAVHTSLLPTALLTMAWDRGLAPIRLPGTVVHAVSLPVPPVRARAGAKGPAVAVMVHDLAWRAHPGATTARGRRWHEAALERALERADVLVTPSAPVAGELEEAGAPSDRVRVIGHGADHLPAPDDSGAASLLGRLGVEGPYLLSAGTLEPRKNLQRLAAAYALARSSLPEPWPLVVVGPRGWGDAGLGEVRGGVVAAGEVGDAVLAALYARARLFAYVPLTEGFGLPPVEAMACGTPVVVSATVPSTSPPPGAEPAAWRVDPGSVEDIAAGLVRLSTDDELRARLVERGRALVAPMTWTRCAADHRALWESMA